MSGSRLTRKVTVEGSKKISDSNAPRKSVFERLGPGTGERSQSRREDYHDSQIEKCRHWLRDGRCPFGSKCRYNHGSPPETKSKLKIIRSVVSKTDETGDSKNEVRLKRFQSQEESSSDQSPKKPSKKHKAEKIKSRKEKVKEGSNARGSREQRREREESKFAEKKKEVILKRSESATSWNLQDQSESDEGNDGKQLDWEERGALTYEREVALEERRNDLRRQIAKIDQHVEPVVTIPNKVDASVAHSHISRIEQDSSPPTYSGDLRPEKKKKTKSDKSKKKSKKKSHKSEVLHIPSDTLKKEEESVEKTKKNRSPISVKKKKKHDYYDDSDHEAIPAEVPPPKQEFLKENTQHEYAPERRGSSVSRVVTPRKQKSRSRHSHEPRHESPHFEHSERYLEESVVGVDTENERQRHKMVKASERSNEGRNKEDRVRKKQEQRSPSREVSVRQVQVTEERKSTNRLTHVDEKEVKRKTKKIAKEKEVLTSSQPIEKIVNKGQKPGSRHNERQAHGPRTPSPDVKFSTVSRNAEGARRSNESSAKAVRKHETGGTEVYTKKISPGFHHSPTRDPRSRKPPVGGKQVVERDINENISESSDSDSSSSEDSASCEVESVSGEEQRNEVVRTEQHRRDNEDRKPEPRTPDLKQELPLSERREEVVRGRDRYPERVERPVDDPRDHPFDEFRERPLEESKERPPEYVRHEERGERYHRERERDRRRPRDEEPERRIDGRSHKDTREIRDNRDMIDHRDPRDYRELPRIDHRELDRYRDRDRERYREFDERERERLPLVDMRRSDGPKPRDYGERGGYGRGGWTRGRHGRGWSAYGPYDGRDPDYDERRSEGRAPQEYDRAYDRDRGQPARGSRYRDVNERHGGQWHERRDERSYREPERGRERFPENRERIHDDTRGPRSKRPARSPEGNRNERRGYREEHERRPCTPPEESEEWDYEEGRSPVNQIREQPPASRKRVKEHSTPRSPRPESTKRKRVASPEPISQDIPRTRDPTPNPVEQQVSSEHEREKTAETDKEREKGSKRSKKDRMKKTKKRKLSESEIESTKNVEMPERKRPRETDQTNVEKQAKKSAKIKKQPEVVVRPWSDLENEDDDSKGQGKSEKGVSELHDQGDVAATTDEGTAESKAGTQVFSDWSDASEDTLLNKVDSSESAEVKEVVAGKTDEKEEKPTGDVDGDGAFDDVYDPISDDEFEAMFAGDEGETEVKKKPTPLPVDEVDWSILGSSFAKKESEPGDFIKRFSAGNVFSRIGLSSSLTGVYRTKVVQEKCAEDAPHMKMKELLANSMGKKLTLGALVAAEARKMRERANVVNDIGPCRRALCARRDFRIRKQLRKLTATKLGTKLVLSHSAVEPVDSELFAMSVSLFRREKQDKEEDAENPLSIKADSSEVLAC